MEPKLTTVVKSNAAYFRENAEYEPWGVCVKLTVLINIISDWETRIHRPLRLEPRTQGVTPSVFGYQLNPRDEWYLLCLKGVGHHLHRNGCSSFCNVRLDSDVTTETNLSLACDSDSNVGGCETQLASKRDNSHCSIYRAIAANC